MIQHLCERPPTGPTIPIAGKVLRIDMERLVRDYEQRFGGGFVREWVQ